MQVWYGIAFDLFGLVSLKDDDRLELWFFHSKQQARSIVTGTYYNNEKEKFTQLVENCKMPEKSNERQTCATGEVSHMVAFFLGPVMDYAVRYALGMNSSSIPLVDKLMKDQPTRIFIPPRPDDKEPAGLFIAPNESLMVVFFSKEQGKELINRWMVGEDELDRESLLSMLSESVLPETSPQKIMRFGAPLDYYLFGGYLLNNHQKEK